MYIFTVASRYLLKRPMSYVAALIIVLIVVLYLLIISVMEGFKDRYMQELQSIQAHMTVRIGNDPGGIVYPEKWAAELEKIRGVKGITIGLEIPAIALFDEGRTVGTVKGVDLDRELNVGKLKDMLSPKEIDSFGEHDVKGKTLHGCIVGGAWQRMFKLKKGDYMTFLFTDDEKNPVAMAFFIVGFFDVKNDYLESTAYVDRKVLARQIKLPDYAKTLSVWVDGDPDRPDLDDMREEVRDRMRELLKRDAAWATGYLEHLEVETWREKVSNLYHAISRENTIMRFIMGIFLLFVIIIIMLILSRLVAEKVRDIGILRAMGATPGGIRACFLSQGVLIAIIGLAAGIPCALLLIQNVNGVESLIDSVSMWIFKAHFRVFPSESFLVSEIPTHVRSLDLVLIAVLTLFAGLLGGLLPSWRASRLDPVECLRHE